MPELQHLHRGRGGPPVRLGLEPLIKPYDFPKKRRLWYSTALPSCTRTGFFNTSRENEEAFGVPDRGRAAAPARVEAWRDLGVIHAAMGRLEAALDCYDRAIALDPNHSAALNNRGNALAALQRPQEA